MNKLTYTMAFIWAIIMLCVSVYGFYTVHKERQDFLFGKCMINCMHYEKINYPNHFRIHRMDVLRMCSKKCGE